MEIDLFPALGRALLYLGIPFVFGIFYLQWKWARTCDRNIRVLVAQKGGGGAFRLAPKEGGEVTITDDNDVSRTWPVNELSTIDVLYPGVGFVPAFMQKTIRLAIVNEGDWEPMLNRSPHREKVASPDVIEYLRMLAEKPSNEDEKKEIEEYLGALSTGPTREMIADPAVLGGLMKSSVFKALATVSNDFTEAMRALTNKLNRVMGPNPYVVYIGLGLSVLLVGYAVFQIITMAGDIEAMKQALGVK